jgi:hypothetical protein
MDQRQLSRRLRAAVAMLYARDGRLLEYAAGERAVVAKLTAYLMPLFRGFDVDMEYNRHGLNPKDVDLPNGCRGKGRQRIYPDIIVHRRGHDRANLLVVEVKKETNPEPRHCDRGKIEAMKREFGYRWGVLLELPAGEGASERQPTEEWL